MREGDPLKSPKPGKNIPPAPKTGMKKHLPAALLFAGIVIVRFLLALATSTYPVVGIDEFLYSSLGRSIATEGSLLYYGQPADYSYILYPLVLSPVYNGVECPCDSLVRHKPCYVGVNRPPIRGKFQI